MPKSPRHPISAPVPELQGIASIASREPRCGDIGAGLCAACSQPVGDLTQHPGCGGALPLSKPTPPVVEEGWREAATIAQVIEEARAKYREPTDWDYGALDACTRIERAILALTPVEGVGLRGVLELYSEDVHCTMCERLVSSGEAARQALLSTPATAQGDEREALEEAFDAGFTLAEGKWHEGTEWNTWAKAKRDEEVSATLATLKGQDNG